MPTYEYECLKCGKSFEAFQKITDEPLKKCPTCEGKVRKLISTGCGLIFKGNGFYVTDYKRKNSPSSQKKGKEECPQQKSQESQNKPSSESKSKTDIPKD